jgi:putative redox protein
MRLARPRRRAYARATMNLLATAHVTRGAVEHAQQIRTGRHTLTADEHAELGGLDAGPTPFQLVLSGLAACTSITLGMYAGKKQWPIGSTHIDLRMFEDGDTRSIERVISFDPALTPEQRTRMLEIAEKTPVTKALRPAFTITTRAATE